MLGPLRILHIIPGLPIGGAERMLEDVVRGVPASLAEHHVFNMQAGGPMQRCLEEAHAKVTSGHMGASRAPLRGMLTLHKLVHALRPDVVHGWMYLGNLAATLAYATGPKKAGLVWGMHSAAPTWPNMGLRRRAVSEANRLLSARPDAIVYVAHASAEAHAQAGFAAQHAHVIAGGVDTQRFVPDAQAGAALRARLGVPPETRLIGMLARLHPMKGHDVLLVAMHRLLSRAPAGPPCHLVLAGEGLAQLPDSLRSLRSAPMQNRLHLLGAVDDTAPILQGLDVCVLSSHQEALPKILLEAMACGVLCVATAVGDVPALLDATGWLSKPCAPEALSRALVEALACKPSEKRTRIATARARIVSRFSQAQFASAMGALYQSVAARGPQ